jgi:transposase
MDLTAELTALNLDCAQQEGVVAAVFPLHAEAEKLRAQAKLDALKIQALTLELAHLKRIRFGVKNEALSPEQRDLFRETFEVDGAAIAAETELLVPALRAPRERAGRQPLPEHLPEHLPRIEHRHEPASCSCGECGGALVKIGEDISEQLDVTPATFFVHRHIRPQYACRPCERIVAAAIPPAVVDGGMAAAGLIAWVLISKYVDHLPLYRIEQIAARAGVTLARSTLADWVGRYGVALQPLADRLSELLKQRCLLHADETPVQQLDPGQGKTKRAYLWAYRSGDLDDGPRIAVFDYQTGRSGAHARAFLEGWKGHLVVDDYAGYKALFAAGVIEVGCMAHARRKFFELHKANQSPVAGEALQRIAELYEIESRGRELANAERQALREREALPTLQAMQEWLQRTRDTVADGGGLARAIDYSLKRWPALARYAHSAILPIDNNPVENVIRPIALGKKNWLFTGSERSGRSAAAIQSLLATAKLNDLKPAAWLKDTLEKLPVWPNSRIDELLPLGLAAE